MQSGYTQQHVALWGVFNSSNTNEIYLGHIDWKRAWLFVAWAWFELFDLSGGTGTGIFVDFAFS